MAKTQDTAMQEWLKEYKYLIALVVFALILRFSTNLPTIWVDDSVKYQVPLQIIATENFDWVLSTLNFSLFARIINYFVQIVNSGSPAGIIFYQKILAIASTTLFYFIALKLCKKDHNYAAIATLIFTVNPLMLFFEQVIMPEAIFIFLCMLLTFFFIKLIENEDHKYSIIIGVILGLFILTKESSGLYSGCIYLAMVIIGLVQFLNNKSKFLLIATVIVIASSQATLIPFKLHTLDKFGKFAVSNFDTKGSMIWFLTEDMLVENPPKIHPWLTTGLLAMTEQFKKDIYKVPVDQYHRFAFESAISKINVLGRENRLMHPETGKILDSSEWSKIAQQYYLECITKNPLKSWESIKYNAHIFLFRDNYYFWPYKKSFRPGSDFEAVQYTQVPFSLKHKVDPMLRGRQLVRTENMDETHVYKDDTKTDYYRDIIPVMVNRNLNQAFLIPETSLALKIQRALKFFPFMRILLPLFLVSILIFLFNKKFWTNFDEAVISLYLIGSTLMFLILPLMVHGEARYQLQFTHFMILFIAYIVNRTLKNDLDQG